MAVLEFDSLRYDYPSRRNVVYAGRAMACTSVPLGAQIGLDVMKSGGNAVDAAVAMAAAMPILEPTGNGLGSDCFALVWIEREQTLYGLNASGTAPLSLNAQTVRALGYDRVPTEGWLPTMVPGAPAGWAALNRRFGTKPLADLFAPAQSYAREGTPVPVNVALQWSEDVQRIANARSDTGDPHAAWRQVFTKEGAPYQAGERFSWPDYADTLTELAQTGCESFYRGRLMERTVAFSRASGGFFRPEDFLRYQPKWVEPITTDYKGYTVCEIPPNGHGLTVLMALNLLSGLSLPPEKDCAQTYHNIAECIKLAFADTKTYVADPDYMKTRVADLLSPAYTRKRRALISDRALLPEPGTPACGDTVYLCTADPDGNMVSFIQSNYTGFGAGIVIPDTGISLQNRGANFSLDPNSDNCLAGGKRAYHTIIPGFLMRDGTAVGPFGVMGAFMQPQGHVQVLVNTIDYHMNPQQALDAPRLQWTKGRHLQLEREVPPAVGRELAEMGHEIEITEHNRSMGRGQIIWRTESGVLIGGTESRCDGTIAAW